MNNEEQIVTRESKSFSQKSLLQLFTIHHSSLQKETF